MTTPATLALVRAHIADAVLPPLPSAALGAITLAPHQQEAAARLHTVIARHRGALLADDVGLGKTFVALAVARAYRHCHVIAPAALMSMWHGARARSDMPHVALHSLHRFSRTPPPALAIRADTLVIIDEAHHLRNADTRRYRQLAEAIAGAHVLLLSATPVHNRAGDLRALLALFAGRRDDLLSDALRAELIVRRNADALMGGVRRAESVESRAVATHDPRPRVREHVAWRAPLDQNTLSRIMALPAPLPARHGAEAGALIRLGLLRAWCSSQAALAYAVRRRRLRGSALRDALRVGRHPTDRELRSWAVGDEDAQLGFAELLAESTVESAPLLPVLERHLEALADLAEHLRRQPDLDGWRARQLRRVLQRHPGIPVVAFSQHARTVQALHRALRDIAGVGMLTGARAHIASGTISREDALARFAPLAQQRPPPPAHQAIRLLITTDLLAEGVNLQDAGVVVHLDLPWTAALRDQRVGRCVRLGAPHALVHVYRIAPSHDVERVVRFEQRVQRKARLGQRAIGAARASDGPVGRAAIRASWLHAALATWRRPDGAALSAHAAAGVPIVAVQRGAQLGAVAVVGDRTTHRLLAVRPRGTAWRATAAAGAVIALVRAASIDRDGAVPAVPLRGDEGTRRAGRAARRAVATWLRRQAAQRLAGAVPSALSAVQREALVHLASAFAQVPIARRPSVSTALAEARRAVLSAHAAGSEAQLRRWLDGPPPAAEEPSAWGEWLARLPRPIPATERPGSDDTDGHPVTLRCLLLLWPD